MELVRTIVLAMHLLAMNVAAAGPILCVWLAQRGRRGDATADGVGKALAWWACTALLIGAVVGALLLDLASAAGDRAYFAALARFPSSAFVYAGSEILFSLVCLVVYAGTWNRWRERPWLHGVWAVLAATNLLYHFPPLMFVLRELADRTEFVADEAITRSVFRSLMVRPEILSQTVHFALASIAVAGVSVMLIARRERKDANDIAAGAIICGGARVALAASLAQLAVGMWVVFELPTGVRDALTGNNGWSTALFFSGIGSAIVALHTLSVAALGETSDRVVRRCAAWMLTAILLMTCVLRAARHTDDGNHATVDTRHGESPSSILQLSLSHAFE